MIFVDYLILLFLLIVILYLLVRGATININVNLTQEMSEKDRKFLEDIYDKDGELKHDEVRRNIDEAVAEINRIMLGEEEEQDG